ncbi:MAG: tetratricopeptide repeat protein [Myxococcales bacterium]|jgi:tetratricopeptide (TPR) repeat protein
MAKSLVDKYEQILDNDPGSLVFIELAKALLERGDAARAIETCRRGVEHHPDSIIGHVLWGKALITCGRPAEAMEQFDKAIAIERDNPQAYNLIGEVLLHKGLYRSALPILKKAVSLQPDDLRVRQWYEQAQRALGVLPPPAAEPQGDATEVDVRALPSALTPTESGLEPTVTELSAYTPNETVPGLTDVFRSLGSREQEQSHDKQPAAASPAEAAPSQPSGLPGAGPASEAPAGAGTPAADLPFDEAWRSPEARALASLEAGADSADVIPGLTGVFQSLAAREENESGAAGPVPKDKLEAEQKVQIDPAWELPAPQPAEKPPESAPSAEGEAAASPAPSTESAEPAATAAPEEPSADSSPAEPPALEVTPDRAAEAEAAEPTREVKPEQSEEPAAARPPASSLLPELDEPPPPPPRRNTEREITAVITPPAEAAPDATSDAARNAASEAASEATSEAARDAASDAASEMQPGGEADERAPAAEEQASVAPPPPAPRAAAEPSDEAAPGAASPPPLPKARPSQGTGLLADLPDLEEDEDPADRPRGGASPSVSVEIPSVVIAPSAAEEIAREYERELREKLLATPPPSFWSRAWLRLSVAAALVVAVALGAAIYVGTRKQNRGNDLIELRTQAFRSLALGTPVGYRGAIELSLRVLEIAPGDKDALAASAYANAALFHRFGGEPGRKRDAERDLERFADTHAGFALAIPYLLATEPKAIEAAAAQVLEADPGTLPEGFERAELLALAGRLLLEAGQPQPALDRLKAAVDADPSHVGTLMALGDYYFGRSEFEQALRFYERVKGASPGHVPALLGAVNCALALETGSVPAADLDQARAAWLSAREAKAEWPADLGADLALAEGKVLALQRKHTEAVARLEQAATEYPTRAVEIWSAIGSVQAQAANYDKAEGAYRRALARQPDDMQLKEELARALIAQGRYGEALKVTDGAPGDDRRLRIVRGIARFEMGQPAKARVEFAATVRNGKVPTEVAIYLALIDAAEGQRETARGVLESAIKVSKERPGLARAALGRLYLEEGNEAQAIAELKAAEADPRDWEGACTLGRHHLKADRFQDALEHLNIAVERNRWHQEARLALGATLLALGQAAQAQEHFASALRLGPSGAGNRGLARALLAQGKLAEARRHSNLAARQEPKHPDNTRLAAQIALASGDAREALRGLQRAVRAAPREPEGFCELGELLVKVGELSDAKKAFRTALSLDRTSLRARLGLVNAALPKEARSVRQKSEQLVARTADSEPRVKARALALNARVLLALGHQGKAAERARAAVQADDSSADAHLSLALVAKATKDSELALAELKRVVGLDPTIAEAHLALADSLATDPTQLERALEEVKIYLRIAPKGPDAAVAKKYAAFLKKKLDGD